MLNATASTKISEGLGNPWICSRTKILQYAANTLVFAQARKDYISVLKTILYHFEQISGLSINYQQSSISTIGQAHLLEWISFIGLTVHFCPTEISWPTVEQRKTFGWRLDDFGAEDWEQASILEKYLSSGRASHLNQLNAHFHPSIL